MKIKIQLNLNNLILIINKLNFKNVANKYRKLTIQTYKSQNFRT